MALPNLAGLSLRPSAPTQELVTLTDKEAERLNRGEEGRYDGHEPITMEDYEGGKQYFRVRKPPPLGGVPRVALFDYHYFDPAELWRFARWNRSNPITRQPITPRDQWWQMRERFDNDWGNYVPQTAHELEQIILYQIHQQAQIARERERRRLGMTFEQYDAFQERQMQARRERQQQARREREAAEAEAERRAREWEAGRDARREAERRERDEWRRQQGWIDGAPPPAPGSDADRD